MSDIANVGGIRPPDVAGIAAQPAAPASAGRTSASKPDFDQILQQHFASGPEAISTESATARVRFSAHAQQRLTQAAVEMDPQTLAKLEAAVDKADAKGGKESLILLDDLAFVVSVQNRTVITAVGADRMADNVFTKIDSVVIARSDENASV